MTKRNRWLLVAFVALMLAAPNGTILRATVLEADVFYLTLCRFLLIGLVCLPFIIHGRKRLFDKKVRKDVLLASVYLTVALISYMFALLYSQASYVTIIMLTSPIIFILLSSKFFGEKMNRRIATGMTLAMIGALTLVILPIAISQNGTAFYPMATVLALVNCVTYALAIIYMRKANEKGVSMSSMIGSSALFVAAVCAVLFIGFGDYTRTPTDVNFWLAICYSGIITALFGRMLNVKAYEHVGASLMSALSYLELFVAILIPVFVLNEKLSPAMVIGGIFILIGVYIVEHHKHPHVKHHITMRH
jgi:drug/metabolite transporter (DMT)-like permease